MELPPAGMSPDWLRTTPQSICNCATRHSIAASSLAYQTNLEPHTKAYLPCPFRACVCNLSSKLDSCLYGEFGQTVNAKQNSSHCFVT